MLMKLYIVLLPLLMLSCSSREDEASAGHPPTADSGLQAFRNDPLATLLLYDFDNPGVVNLPDQLSEISGLAVDPDGNLYGHNDEQGIVYRIDPETGEILERFALGSIGVEEDFEGIEIVGERFFLVNSSGDLYEFRKGADRSHVEFTTIETGLSGKFDVEGLCYDPSANSLLLACKEYPGKNFKAGEHRTVYAFSLERMKLDPEPRFVIPAREIADVLHRRNFKPSGIAHHAASNTFLVLSSNDPAIAQLASDGSVLAARELPGLHKQPEGIVFDGKGRLLIANEGGKLVAIQNSK